MNSSCQTTGEQNVLTLAFFAFLCFIVNGSSEIGTDNFKCSFTNNSVCWKSDLFYIFNDLDYASYVNDTTPYVCRQSIMLKLLNF